MKKNLLLSSLLLGSVLVHTGCVEKDLNPPMNNHFNPSNNTTRIKQPVVVLNSELTVQEESRVIESITPIQVVPEQVTPTQTKEDTYQLPTIKGDMITVKINKTGFEFPQYTGKVVLLQLFGKKCKHCFEEMPIIRKIREKYGDSLQVIAIQAEQEKMTSREASSLISQYHMNYPIIERENAADLLVFLRDKYEWIGTLPYLLLIKDEFMQSTNNSYESLVENIDDL